MRIPAYTQQNFLNAHQPLLPPRIAWPRDTDAVMTAVFTRLSPTSERPAARALNLLTDINPASTIMLLLVWEATLGIPDLCVGLSPAIQQRRTQVVALVSN